jgi:hypothetical protein
VAKDARNDFQKYDYTSAEEMIKSCRKVLLANKLVFVRTSWSLIDGPAVSCTYKLVHHPSGEHVEISGETVLVSSKQQDKTQLAVLTTSMNYTLRDLLMLPRCEADQPEIDNMEASHSSSPPRVTKVARGEAMKKDAPPPAPAYMIASLGAVFGQKPDPEEYEKKLLSAASRKYGRKFEDVSQLPEEYVSRVFEAHDIEVTHEPPPQELFEKDQD